MSRGQKPPKMPVLYGQKINVFKLYSAVVKRGGYEVVTEEKRWKEEIEELMIDVPVKKISGEMVSYYQTFNADWDLVNSHLNKDSEHTKKECSG